MFKLKAHGRVAAVDYPVLSVEVAHHEAGYREPIRLFCTLPYLLREAAADLAVGDPIWLEGNAYQYRHDRGPELRLNVTMMAKPSPSLIDGRGSLYATVHGHINSDVDHGTVDKGSRAGQEYLRFTLHVQVPEMPRTKPAVLRVKGWDGESAWIANNHNRDDRINLEGNLFEVRFQDSDGVPRVAHQLVIAEWWWGKTQSTPGTVVSERVTSRPVQSAPRVVRRTKA